MHSERQGALFRLRILKAFTAVSFDEPLADGPKRCHNKFLRYFPGGFEDQKYIAWERGYKWTAHQRWQEILGQEEHRALIRRGQGMEVAARAVRIESRTNLLFSFEKMAVRDAVKSEAGARLFAKGLYELLYSSDELETRFTDWCEVVAKLPRKQTRVLTWPVVTVFGFIAQPRTHFFLKPKVTRLAAQEYGYGLVYEAPPHWKTYVVLLNFAAVVRRDLRDLRPRDMIDIQSVLWVQGSDEYPG